jgi:hypothetical protein
LLRGVVGGVADTAAHALCSHSASTTSRVSRISPVP